MKIVLVGRQAVAAVAGVVLTVTLIILNFAGYSANSFAEELLQAGMILGIPFCFGVIVGAAGLARDG